MIQESIVQFGEKVVIVRNYLPSPTVTWNAWARHVALVSLYLMIVAGIIGCFYHGFSFVIGIFAIVTALLLLPFLWPLKHLKEALLLFQHFYIAALLLFIISVVCFLSFPTFIAAIAILISAVFYFFAGLQRETPLTLEKVLAQ